MEGKADDEGQRSINDGDWICPDSQCGNVNFARRNSCNRCGKDRGECPKKKKLGQEIGKAAAEKSRGLFSADDWQCSKCGNVNWARRQQCNMCNAPKFGEVEERTGYGGGYNDRGVVEYKERKDDDDDEYDEFGRRRKKRKVDNRSSDEDSKDSIKYVSPPRSKSKEDVQVEDFKAEQNQGENNEEGEEEEEEEDDDGDLSKYDLSEWDDFVPVKQNANGKVASSRDQRSRWHHAKRVIGKGGATVYQHGPMKAGAALTMHTNFRLKFSNIASEPALVSTIHPLIMEFTVVGNPVETLQPLEIKSA